MTKFLASATRHALLSDLASNGYEWKDENGIPRIPEPFEMTVNGYGHCAIYLGRIPTTDAEGNTTYSTQFCANVTDTEGQFDTEIDAPETPYNTFA
jgi:hypothetical protein